MKKKKIYFIANWKMYGKKGFYKDLKKINSFSKIKKKIKIIICPPLIFINFFIKKIKKKLFFSFGSQDISKLNFDFGSYTGETSAQMLKNNNIKYVIIGHSERRKLGDTQKIIRNKIISANSKNLKIIFCIGESSKEKKNKKSIIIIQNQILSSIPKNINFKNLMIAYEPIWAIGTGNIPTEKYLNYVFFNINKILKKNFNISNLKLLYGGSVNEKNIFFFKKIKYIDGFLVGSASLKSSSFIKTIENYK